MRFRPMEADGAARQYAEVPEEQQHEQQPPLHRPQPQYPQPRLQPQQQSQQPPSSQQQQQRQQSPSTVWMPQNSLNSCESLTPDCSPWMEDFGDSSALCVSQAADLWQYTPTTTAPAVSLPVPTNPLQSALSATTELVYRAAAAVDRRQSAPPPAAREEHQPSVADLWLTDEPTEQTASQSAMTNPWQYTPAPAAQNLTQPPAVEPWEVAPLPPTERCVLSCCNPPYLYSGGRSQYGGEEAGSSGVELQSSGDTNGYSGSASASTRAQFSGGVTISTSTSSDRLQHSDAGRLYDGGNAIDTGSSGNQPPAGNVRRQ